MKIDKKKILELAHQHFFSLTDVEIDYLRFEIKSYTLIKLRELKTLTHLFDHLPATNLPVFIQLNFADLVTLSAPVKPRNLFPDPLSSQQLFLIAKK